MKLCADPSPSPTRSFTDRPRHITIVCDWFLLRDGSRLRAGGTETFMHRLLTLMTKLGFSATVLQRADHNFEKKLGDVPILGWTSFRDLTAILLRHSAAGACGVVYSDIHVVPRSIVRPAVLVQHGIYWDVPYRRYDSPFLQRLLNYKKRWDHSRRALHLADLCSRMDRVVTVDTNFQNWLRAHCSWVNFEEKFAYVPNCTTIQDPVRVARKLAGGPLRRVLFARRFDVMRGTFLWANVVRRLAPRFPEIEFVFCGHGGDMGRHREDELRSLLAPFPNVSIYERPWEQMAEEHLAADIEVVPSMGSEGTSYSLVEALGAGTCVICTTVGGLANIVLPDWNGLMVQATENAIEEAALRLLENPARTKALARQGYESAQASFSVEMWESRMTPVLRETFDRG